MLRRLWLCRVRAKKAEPICTWATLFVLFCLSEIRAKDLSGLQWLKDISGQAEEEHSGISTRVTALSQGG